MLNANIERDRSATLESDVLGNRELWAIVKDFVVPCRF